VMYRGALWDVELGQGAHPQAGVFKIVEVQGSRLIVTGA
ncbi:MAG: NfeD family protein, partial [Massilia sp.]|nr:NfeD family protein [Massilia sp.]